MRMIIRMLGAVGLLLAAGILHAQYQEEALDIIIQKVEEGNGYYQGMLGAIYRRGERGETNMMEALKWLQKSAEQGNPIGLYHYALLYEVGEVVPKDSTIEKGLHAKAYPGLVKLAETGDARAMVCLGVQNEVGFCGKIDVKAANRWYRESAELGFPVAQFILGYQYYHGIGIEKDLDSAIVWVRNAAGAGYPAAQHFLGNRYVNGDGVPKDSALAVYWHRVSENHVFDDRHWRKLRDMVIPGVPPPRFKLDIPEGSCGEACLWSVINADSFRCTQIETNYIAGNRGRGLYTYELPKVLDYYGIKNLNLIKRSLVAEIMGYVNPFIGRKVYEAYLYDIIIPSIKKGRPILLGVKNYPNRFPFWDQRYWWHVDHFILLVGYNEDTNELIFNDFNKRKRIDADDLLQRRDGYSIVNKSGYLNAIIFTDFKGDYR